VDVPDVRYARAGGVAIAYQVVGEGPQTLVFSPHLSDLFTLWMSPHTRPFLDRLAGEVRLVVFNPRGTGVSDRPRNVSLEARMDDITAVLDAVGSERANLLGVSQSANTCALFAATYPERCERLVLYRALPRGLRSDSYPFGDTEEGWLSWIRTIRERWGENEFHKDFAVGVDPTLLEIPHALDWLTWQNRLSASPTSAADWARIGMETDITDVLGSIRIPVLNLYRQDEREIAEFVGGRIGGARTVPVRSLYSDEAAGDLVLEFVRGEAPAVIPESTLATILFTDLFGSTERAAALGDRAWGDVLAAHHRSVRIELRRHRGVEIDSAGDGFFCRFDGPARAIACARRIVEGARELELDVRAGVHTGECEVVGEKIAGIAVVTGARISSLAAPGEVLVSGTVKDLVAGSGFAFESRGEHELKGVPGEWRIYAVVDA
jgi:class 3 adenylate cyclase/pimeloyl-ACP methyl ester carboxylesterase